ncbi:putative ATPase [Sulfolobus islandicus rod-shaped virus]|nr:putative ATPase [Sulfolobus islandicus rod-shaped virus]
MSSNFQFLDKVKSHSFFYNPRDTERVLNIILSGKQIEESKKIEILKAYKRGIDQQYFQSYLLYNNEVKFISKITQFKVKDGSVVAKFQNGFVGEFDPHFIADNPEDFYNLITSYMFVKIRKGIEGWHIYDIYSIEPPNNYEIAKELFELANQQYQTYALLLQSFGYDPSKMEINDIFLFLPRLFPLFKSPITKRQINYIEISNRGTGKTTTFMILQEVFNFRYYTESPTYANLIYDARNNMYGAVFLSNGLIFDEIQNWKDGFSTKELNTINSTLSTGIENCIWTRGAGTESKSATIQKCIPIIYAGNPYSYTINKLVNPDVEDYLQNYEIFTSAILDRIHIIQLAIKKTYDKIINAQVLYPSILKALIELIQQKINSINNYVNCENLESRRKEQSIDIQILLQALDIDLQIGKVQNEEICNRIINLMRFSNLGG